VCNEFGEKLSIGEVSGNKQVIKKYIEDEGNNGLTLVFDFEMLNFKFTADYFHGLIQNIEANFPRPYMPVYVFSNHDKRRSIHGLGEDVRKAKLLHMLQLTVRGVPCLYYGEELGMVNSKLPFHTAFDPIPHKFKFLPRLLFDTLRLTINRDEVRTPMQWDTTRNAGFSSAEKTWLPVNENYKLVNVEEQSKADDSLLNTIRALLKIRKCEKALHNGSLKSIENLPRNVLGYARESENERLVILLNFDEHEKEFQFESSECVFKLSPRDEIKNKVIHLDGLSGMILK
jgi:alpha-glucosidase